MMSEGLLSSAESTTLLKLELACEFMVKIIYIYIHTYKNIHIRSMWGQYLFRSLSAHQPSPDQMKNESAQTTTRAVGIFIYRYIRIYIHE